MAPKEGGDLFDRLSYSTSTSSATMHKYGVGGYGATFAAKDKTSGEELAVKLVDKRRLLGGCARRPSRIFVTSYF